MMAPYSNLCAPVRIDTMFDAEGSAILIPINAFIGQLR